MLVLAGILITGSCVLVVLYAVQAYQLRQRMAAVTAAVREDVDQKTRQDRDNNLTLAKRLCDGEPTGDAVHRWQAERAGILPTGKTDRPWKWTADDLRHWVQDESQRRADQIRRRALATMVVSAVSVILLTATVSLAYYHGFAKHGGATAGPTRVFTVPDFYPADVSTVGDPKLPFAPDPPGTNGLDPASVTSGPVTDSAARDPGASP